jgi:hypothetical protein
LEKCVARYWFWDHQPPRTMYLCPSFLCVGWGLVDTASCVRWPIWLITSRWRSSSIQPRTSVRACWCIPSSLSLTWLTIHCIFSFSEWPRRQTLSRRSNHSTVARRRLYQMVSILPTNGWCFGELLKVRNITTRKWSSDINDPRICIVICRSFRGRPPMSSLFRRYGQPHSAAGWRSRFGVVHCYGSTSIWRAGNEGKAEPDCMPYCRNTGRCR